MWIVARDLCPLRVEKSETKYGKVRWRPFDQKRD